MGAALHRVSLLALLSVVAGLLTAAVAFPVFGGLGVAARDAANSFDSLPTDLVSPPMERHSVIRAANGSVIAVLRGPEDRQPVALTGIAVSMQQAIVAIEDDRFYQHPGLDLRGILRAALKDSSGGALQGGSTITQQYVKDVLLQVEGTAAERDTLARKLQDARYAIALAKRVSKSQILDDYLNLAYFGESSYGVASAAQHYFRENADALSLPQSAMLAGMVEDPSRYDPVADPAQSLERRNTVLARMAQLAMISSARAHALERRPLGVHVRASAAEDPCESSSAPFFCRYVLNQLLADRALGDTQAARTQEVFEGGLTIDTTLQPGDEQAAQKAVSTIVPDSNPAAAPIVMVRPGTGAVLAMTENRRYGPTGTDSTEVVYGQEQGQLGQFSEPGSSFKLFTLITALQEGLPTTTSFFAPACLVLANPPPGFGSSPTNPDNGACPSGYQNADPAEAGTYSMVTGTWFSVNTYFIQLEAKVGLANVKATAEALGVPAATVDKAGGSLTVGGLTDYVSPLVMSEAYATVAAQGRYCTPKTITSITGPDNHRIAGSFGGRCRQLINPQVANTVTAIMEGDIDEPGATAYGTANIGRPAAGKTGTNDNYNSAWFVGFTPQLATAVALANPKAPNSSLAGICVPSGCYSQVYGGGLPAMTWAMAMRAALANSPVEDFPLPQLSAPPPRLPHLPVKATRTTAVAGHVPGVVGEPLGAATAALTAAGYHTTVAGSIPSATTPAGDVADESPAAGSSLPRGGTVSVLVSSGPPKTSPPGGHHHHHHHHHPHPG